MCWCTGVLNPLPCGVSPFPLPPTPLPTLPSPLSQWIPFLFLLNLVGYRFHLQRNPGHLCPDDRHCFVGGLCLRTRVLNTRNVRLLEQKRAPKKVPSKEKDLSFSLVVFATLVFSTKKILWTKYEKRGTPRGGTQNGRISDYNARVLQKNNHFSRFRRRYVF